MAGAVERWGTSYSSTTTGYYLRSTIYIIVKIFNRPLRDRQPRQDSDDGVGVVPFFLAVLFAQKNNTRVLRAIKSVGYMEYGVLDVWCYSVLIQLST